MLKKGLLGLSGLLGEQVGVIGENVQIRRFARFVLGEGLEKKVDDLAIEVAKLTN